MFKTLFETPFYVTSGFRRCMLHTEFIHLRFVLNVYTMSLSKRKIVHQL